LSGYLSRDPKKTFLKISYHSGENQFFYILCEEQSVQFFPDRDGRIISYIKKSVKKIMDFLTVLEILYYILAYPVNPAN